MTVNEINEAHDLLLWYQTMIKPDMAREIWGDRWEHYWEKWETSRGVVFFWSRLDERNKRLLLHYYEEHVWTT